ncbi:MAG TPA: zf-HC2 domain-containing protein [Paracoccaceae bacterium]
MLTCREVAERAEDWIDQELSLWAALQMRLHLAMCKGCSRFIGQMRVTRDLADIAMQTGDTPEADDARISAIFSKLHEAKPTGA